MGSGISQHEDERKVESSAAKSLSVVQSKDEESSKPAKQESSGCPMKRLDGSYAMDWGAMFRPLFPHGPSGSRPLTEDQVREKTAPSASSDEGGSGGGGGGCPVKHKPVIVSSDEGGGGGCPVKNKHGEYNVYSQPIDPKNNMPSVANQMPAPGQSKPLSTERVVSNIPKVRQCSMLVMCYMMYVYLEIGHSQFLF
jgi:hypothetical protein